MRAATAAAHQRVDAAFSDLNLSDRSDYGRFLQAQAAAFLPLEDALDRGAAPALPVDWPRRKRSASLLADLAELGLPAPHWARLEPVSNRAAALGTLYVLEGSRLGGALLKRGVNPAFPTRFLSSDGSSLWRKLLEVLEQYIISGDEMLAAETAALDAFGSFEASAGKVAKEANA